MNISKCLAVIKNLENNIWEKYPLKTILFICIIVVLCQLKAVKSDVSSIESDVSSIQSEIIWIQGDISSIKSEIQ